MGSATTPAKPELALRWAALVIRAAAVFMRCCNRSSSVQEAKPPGTGALSTNDPVVVAFPPGAAAAGAAFTPVTSSARPHAVTAMRRSIAEDRRAVCCGRIIRYPFPRVGGAGRTRTGTVARDAGSTRRILDATGHRRTPLDGHWSDVDLSDIGAYLSHSPGSELACPCRHPGRPGDRDGGWVAACPTNGCHLARVRRRRGRPERSRWPAAAPRRRHCTTWPGCCASCAAGRPASRAKPG